MARSWHFGVLALAALLLGCTDMTPAPPGSSPLANAVVNREAAMAMQLLDSGASPNSADERGTAALILAAVTDQYRLANLLVQRGADVWAADSMGYTAAIYASTSRLDDESDEGKARLVFISTMRAAGYSWPPPWPKDVLAMKDAGRWPPRPAQ
ncbi:ankyrin repeat domain-containing protein [Novosphingobium sp.]|uniref:ankyrin repeat domain-containing protein n=1 Tax=Novosphingobium sp. TaxID=1874826 RepID=UPI003524CE6F